jgi:hypothetical protein
MAVICRVSDSLRVEYLRTKQCWQKTSKIRESSISEIWSQLSLNKDLYVLVHICGSMVDDALQAKSDEIYTLYNATILHTCYVII